VLLHDLEEFDNDLARWSDQDLSLASLFGIILYVSGGRGTRHTMLLRQSFKTDTRVMVEMNTVKDESTDVSEFGRQECPSLPFAERAKEGVKKPLVLVV
jgi:hypothetical protein